MLIEVTIIYDGLFVTKSLKPNTVYSFSKFHKFDFSDATGSNMEIGGGVDDEDEEEFYDSEPLPILGRCKSLYPFEGKFIDSNWYFKMT